MRKIIFTIVFSVIVFILENILYDIFGKFFLPNLMLLFVIYINLAFGIRFSILAASLAGILEDSFGTGVFGQSIFVYLLSAYFTTYLKRYLHYVASQRSRLLLVFFVSIFCFLTQLLVHWAFGSVNIVQSLRFVLIPEVITTLIITTFFFQQMRRCVLKLFV